MEEGYVRISRKIINNPMYFSEPFTRTQAWIDLIMIANFKPGFFRVRGIKVDIKRGQVGYTATNLGIRWKWSKNKVLRYLNELSNDKQIELQKNNVTTLITILKYNQYQTDGTQTDIQTEHKRVNSRNAKKTQTATNKKDKKDKKDKKEREKEIPALDLPPVFFIEIDKLEDYLCSDVGWCEIIAMQNSELKTIEDVHYQIHLFVDLLRERGETGKPTRDAKSHFTNWYKINKRNEKRASKNIKESSIPSSESHVSAVAAGFARAAEA